MGVTWEGRGYLTPRAALQGLDDGGGIIEGGQRLPSKN